MQSKIPLPDKQPVAVNALRNLRAKIAGQIAMHEGEARQLRAELIHINAVLRLFDAETDPEGLPIRKGFRAAWRTSPGARSAAEYMTPCVTMAPRRRTNWPRRGWR